MFDNSEDDIKDGNSGLLSSDLAQSNGLIGNPNSSRTSLPSISKKSQLFDNIDECLKKKQLEDPNNNEKVFYCKDSILRKLEKNLGSLDLLTQIILKLENQQVEDTIELIKQFQTNGFSFIPPEYISLIKDKDSNSLNQVVPHVFTIFYKLKSLLLHDDQLVKDSKSIHSINKLITLMLHNACFALLEYKQLLCEANVQIRQKIVLFEKRIGLKSLHNMCLYVPQSVSLNAAIDRHEILESTKSLKNIKLYQILNILVSKVRDMYVDQHFESTYNELRTVFKNLSTVNSINQFRTQRVPFNENALKEILTSKDNNDDMKIDVEIFNHLDQFLLNNDLLKRVRTSQGFNQAFNLNSADRTNLANQSNTLINTADYLNTFVKENNNPQKNANLIDNLIGSGVKRKRVNSDNGSYFSIDDQKISNFYDKRKDKKKKYCDDYTLYEDDDEPNIFSNNINSSDEENSDYSDDDDDSVEMFNVKKPRTGDKYIHDDSNDLKMVKFESPDSIHGFLDILQKQLVSLMSKSDNPIVNQFSSKQQEINKIYRMIEKYQKAMLDYYENLITIVHDKFGNDDLITSSTIRKSNEIGTTIQMYSVQKVQHILVERMGTLANEVANITNMLDENSQTYSTFLNLQFSLNHFTLTSALNHKSKMFIMNFLPIEIVNIVHMKPSNINFLVSYNSNFEYLLNNLYQSNFNSSNKKWHYTLANIQIFPIEYFFMAEESKKLLECYMDNYKVNIKTIANFLNIIFTKLNQVKYFDARHLNDEDNQLKTQAQNSQNITVITDSVTPSEFFMEFFYQNDQLRTRPYQNEPHVKKILGLSSILSSNSTVYTNGPNLQMVNLFMYFFEHCLLVQACTNRMQKNTNEECDELIVKYFIWLIENYCKLNESMCVRLFFTIVFFLNSEMVNTIDNQQMCSQNIKVECRKNVAFANLISCIRESDDRSQKFTCNFLIFKKHLSDVYYTNISFESTDIIVTIKNMNNFGDSENDKMMERIRIDDEYMTKLRNSSCFETDIKDLLKHIHFVDDNIDVLPSKHKISTPKTKNFKEYGETSNIDNEIIDVNKNLYTNNMSIVFRLANIVCQNTMSLVQCKYVQSEVDICKMLYMKSVNSESVETVVLKLTGTGSSVDIVNKLRNFNIDQFKDETQIITQVEPSNPQNESIVTKLTFDKDLKLYNACIYDALKRDNKVSQFVPLDETQCNLNFVKKNLHRLTTYMNAQKKQADDLLNNYEQFLNSRPVN